MKTKLFTYFIAFLMTSILSIGNASAQCVASFIASPDSSGNVSFVNTSTGNYVASIWSFGDGTSGTGNNIVHAYNANGNYLACLTIFDSIGQCQSTFCDTIVVGSGQSNCQAYFNYTILGNGGVQFYGSANFDTTLITSACYWTFGDGTYSYSWLPSHTYSSTGNYQICFTVIDSITGCSDTYCSNVFVQVGSGSSCAAAFSFQASASTGYFYGYSNTGSITNYAWSFGDGSTGSSSSPTHVYASAGLYNVCLIATFASGCVDTTCSTIAISGASACQAYFTTSPNSANGITFWNQSNLDSSLITSSSYWSFGDGSTSWDWNPSHLYSNAGYYSVCLTIIDSLNGCSDTYCDSVYVGNSAGCNASFSAIDSGSYYFFIPASANAATYNWSFGDGTTSTLAYPAHQYAAPGTYVVTLTVTMNGLVCASTSVVVVGGTSNCTAYFTAYGDSINPGNFYFYNQSTGNNLTYYWYFGDGSSSTLSNPTHTYANQGTYLVCLTIYNVNGPCQASYCDSVVVGNGQSSCVPQFYAFPDSSFGNGVMNFGIFNPCPGYQYVWTATNGTSTYTSSGTNPIIAFVDSGWYSVCVDAFDSTGAVISYCDSVYVLRVGSVGIFETQNLLPVQAFPNPTSGPITINYILNNAQKVMISIINMNGQGIYTSEEQRSSGLQQLHLNTAEWPAGLYLINVKAGEQQNSTRISVQH